MFALRYMASELRRRKGRTVLAALGLGLGVALVVAVGALSTGLDRAQARILEPLTGVGTDLSVTRPIRISATASSGGGPGFPRLSAKEREQLERETRLAGASVTTAEDLADRVSGSLVDANGLVDRLGLALAAIGLFAAFAFAALLTLGSVAKRVREPRVIADEPTGNLDSATGEEIVALLGSLSGDHGRTVVVVTHDPALAERATRVVSMRDGRLAGRLDPALAPG